MRISLAFLAALCACNASTGNNNNGNKDTGGLTWVDGGSTNIDYGDGVVGQACAPKNLVPIQFKQAREADALLALAMSYADGPTANLSPLTIGAQTRGYLFVDPSHEIGGFLAEHPSTGQTSSDEETKARGLLAKVAAVTKPVVQPFKSWDGFEAAIATYDFAVGGGDDLKGRLNAVAKILLGATVGGLFADGKASAGHKEGWRLQLEVVRRPNNTTIVLGALTTLSKVTGAGSDPVQRFLLRDVGGGSALGHALNISAVQCDEGKSTKPKIDFLWVVDDSCSMDPHQTAVARAADAFVGRLKISEVDFRVALIATSYWQDAFRADPTVVSKNYGVIKGFTSDLAEFKSWLKQPCPLTDKSCIGSEQCTGTEKGIESAYDALLNPKNGATALLPTPGPEDQPDPKRLRRGAKLVLIFVSDAGDQSHGEAKYVVGSSPPPASDATDGPWFDKALGTWPDIFAKIAARPDLDGMMAGAILCSDGSCGETKNPSLYDVLVQQTSGVQGDIMDDASVDATMQGIVDAAIGATGMQLSKPPISASLKVVQGNASPLCPQPTPQHPDNGYVYDGVTNRLSFFGNCRPTAVGNPIAVSYKYWIDRGPLE
jgi:hypothetical protein